MSALLLKQKITGIYRAWWWWRRRRRRWCRRRRRRRRRRPRCWSRGTHEITGPPSTKLGWIIPMNSAGTLLHALSIEVVLLKALMTWSATSRLIQTASTSWRSTWRTVCRWWGWGWRWCWWWWRWRGWWWRWGRSSHPAASPPGSKLWRFWPVKSRHTYVQAGSIATVFFKAAVSWIAANGILHAILTPTWCTCCRGTRHRCRWRWRWWRWRWCWTTSTQDAARPRSAKLQWIVGMNPRCATGQACSVPGHGDPILRHKKICSWHVVSFANSSSCFNSSMGSIVLTADRQNFK